MTRHLNELIEALPVGRRAKVEARAEQLLAEEIGKQGLLHLLMDAERVLSAASIAGHSLYGADVTMRMRDAIARFNATLET
jgi:putative exporter of polyketide antibiotics